MIKHRRAGQRRRKPGPLRAEGERWSGPRASDAWEEVRWRGQVPAGAATSSDSVAPFEGLVPGLTTAGALAVELGRAWGVIPWARAPAALYVPPEEDWATATGCRRALPEPDRLAFDAAALALADQSEAPFSKHLYGIIAGAWFRAPAALAKLTAVALMLGSGCTVAGVAERLAHGPKRHPACNAALVAIIEATLAAGDKPHGHDILLYASPVLGRAEVARLDGLLRELTTRGVVPSLRALRASAVACELDQLLAPELSLLDTLAKGAFAPQVVGYRGAYFVRVLEDLGLPPTLATRLSPEERKLAEPPARALLEDNDDAGVPVLLAILGRLLGPREADNAALRLERSLHGWGAHSRGKS